MLRDIETMFDDMNAMMKKLKKKSYEMNMGQFLEKNGHYFQEMTDYLDHTEDKEKAAGEIAERLAGSVENKFASGSKKKIASYVQADINFFMIYYVFPAILKTEHQDARLLADTICKVWAKTFKNSEINYTDYDTLYGTFREKIFGIF